MSSKQLKSARWSCANCEVLRVVESSAKAQLLSGLRFLMNLPFPIPSEKVPTATQIPQWSSSGLVSFLRVPSKKTTP